MTDITWTTEQRKLSDLAEWEHNPAEITDHDAQQLKRSIDKFGLALPLIANVNGGLIDGHQRKMVMLMLDGHLPSELVDVRIPSRELSEEERTELAVRLRKNVGDWNWDTLTNEFEIDDLKDWGFTDVDFELAGWDTEEEPPPDPGAQIDKAAELQEKWGTALGQVWELGDHRLVCGDCTDAAVVESVMRGESTLLMVTDPPYGVSYDPMFRERVLGAADRRTGVIANDAIQSWQSAFDLFTGDIAYVWHADRQAVDSAVDLMSCGFVIVATIIWSKPHSPFGQGHYNYQHEPCWYAVRKGGKAHWVGKKDTTVWNISLDSTVDGAHGTQKPLECMERPMAHHAGDVYDPFLGSGTTLIACERLNRRCRAIEIEPKYVAVTLQRWHDMTNREPVLAGQ